MMYYLATPMVSFFVAFGMLSWLLKGAMASAVLDHPNQRSLHSHPRPRTGGLALIVAVLAAWVVAQSPWGWAMMSMVFFLSAVSFLDDVRGLSVIWRFLAHFATAGVFVAVYVQPGLGFVGAVLAVLATVWMTNLYNFMDGSDGLAGGMALFGFGFYGLAASLHGDAVFAGLCWSVVAASVAFLVFNFYPARIFMGDAGSIPLGFLAAALGLLGWRVGYWPLWFPMLVFSPFILDASVTLTKRLLRREKVWQAHCEHYYQRLVQIGWGHRRTALAEYLLMALSGISAIWALKQDEHIQMAVCISWGVAYLLAMWQMDFKWSRRKKGG